MGARSRKRKRSGARATDAAAKSRAPAAPPASAPPPAADDKLSRGYARSRARDDEIRANLVPLAPGERPGVVTFAAVVAFVFAIANVATALTGNDISSATGDPSVATAVTTALLLVAGFGMLARQYWAVLGFETILGLQIVFFSLYLIGVQKWWHAIVPLVAIGLLGWLFWKLVSAMARLQMPKRPADEA
ncbi:MAG: hypothetical protein Q8K79_10685 [Solirubrobacteraceae bacterium]|nr:hypothetical protein [Solirubrobacteraceae bacterium]